MPFSPKRPACPRLPRPTGSALIFVLALVLVLAVAGAALIRIAGGDRIDAASMGRNDRGIACAEAGLQYARRFFGTTYETTHGWNDYLDGSLPGYRHDAAANGPSELSSLPLQARGASNGSTLDPGADVDGNGGPDFRVSMRDDDDERPLGIADDQTRDNNERVVIRSECTNPNLALTQGGRQVNVVLESVLTHIQGSSGYGTSAAGSNATDLVGGR